MHTSMPEGKTKTASHSSVDECAGAQGAFTGSSASWRSTYTSSHAPSVRTAGCSTAGGTQSSASSSTQISLWEETTRRSGMEGGVSGLSAARGGGGRFHGVEGSRAPGSTPLSDVAEHYWEASARSPRPDIPPRSSTSTSATAHSTPFPALPQEGPLDTHSPAQCNSPEWSSATPSATSRASHCGLGRSARAAEKALELTTASVSTAGVTEDSRAALNVSHEFATTHAPQASSIGNESPVLSAAVGGRRPVENASGEAAGVALPPDPVEVSTGLQLLEGDDADSTASPPPPCRPGSRSSSCALEPPLIAQMSFGASRPNYLVAAAAGTSTGAGLMGDCAPMDAPELEASCDVSVDGAGATLRLAHSSDVHLGINEASSQRAALVSGPETTSTAEVTTLAQQNVPLTHAHPASADIVAASKEHLLHTLTEAVTSVPGSSRDAASEQQHTSTAASLGSASQFGSYYSLYHALNTTATGNEKHLSASLGTFIDLHDNRMLMPANRTDPHGRVLGGETLARAADADSTGVAMAPPLQARGETLAALERVPGAVLMELHDFLREPDRQAVASVTHSQLPEEIDKLAQRPGQTIPTATAPVLPYESVERSPASPALSKQSSHCGGKIGAMSLLPHASACTGPSDAANLGLGTTDRFGQPFTSLTALLAQMPLTEMEETEIRKAEATRRCRSHCSHCRSASGHHSVSSASDAVASACGGTVSTRGRDCRSSGVLAGNVNRLTRHCTLCHARTHSAKMTEEETSHPRSRDYARSTRSTRRGTASAAVHGLEEVLAECQFLSMADVVAAVTDTSDQDLQRARAHVAATSSALLESSHASFATAAASSALHEHELASDSATHASAHMAMSASSSAPAGGGHSGACGCASVTCLIGAVEGPLSPSITTAEALTLAAAMTEVSIHSEAAASLTSTPVEDLARPRGHTQPRLCTPRHSLTPPCLPSCPPASAQSRSAQQQQQQQFGSIRSLPSSPATASRMAWRTNSQPDLISAHASSSRQSTSATASVSSSAALLPPPCRSLSTSSTNFTSESLSPACVPQQSTTTVYHIVTPPPLTEYRTAEPAGFSEGPLLCGPRPSSPEASPADMYDPLEHKVCFMSSADHASDTSSTADGKRGPHDIHTLNGPLGFPDRSMILTQPRGIGGGGVATQRWLLQPAASDPASPSSPQATTRGTRSLWEGFPPQTPTSGTGDGAAVAAFPSRMTPSWFESVVPPSSACPAIFFGAVQPTSHVAAAAKRVWGGTIAGSAALSPSVFTGSEGNSVCAGGHASEDGSPLGDRNPQRAPTQWPRTRSRSYSRASPATTVSAAGTRGFPAALLLPSRVKRPVLMLVADDAAATGPATLAGLSSRPPASSPGLPRSSSAPTLASATAVSLGVFTVTSPLRPFPSDAAPSSARAAAPAVTTGGTTAAARPHVMVCTALIEELSRPADLVRWARESGKITAYLRPSTETEVTT